MTEEDVLSRKAAREYTSTSKKKKGKGGAKGKKGKKGKK
jgi:hypothetical protein